MNLQTASRLVQYRKQRGFSQETLANELGVSRQAVSKWERAEASPDTDNLISLARLYGISLDELLDNTPDMHPAPIPEAPEAAAPFADPGHSPADPSPGLDQILETALYSQITKELEASVDENDKPPHVAYTNQRPSLSPGAQQLLRLILLGGAAVLFLLYGFLSMLFPALEDAYPVLCVLGYLACGFAYGWWHPGWMIFLTIPLMGIFFW